MRRRSDDAGFLTRSEEEWASLLPRRFVHSVPQLLALAGSVLAKAGQLRPDEVERLRDVARCDEQHPRIEPDVAALLLEEHWTAGGGTEPPG